MPLMMDDDMEVDIDDLFGDGAGGLLPPSRPPPKELFQRVDELRGSGCCQCVLTPSPPRTETEKTQADDREKEHCVVALGIYCFHHFKRAGLRIP